MNKRICFAGFTGEEVVSIKQAVTGNVRAWDCAFAQDGPDTIAEISAEPYDAVVANLQMDGMRGDEVLQQAVKLQPDALRFIVGDSSDTTIIFSCIKDGNNFIARTPNPDEILSAVQRGFELDSQVASEKFAQAALARPEASPSQEPDKDWMLRVLIPATVIAVLIALLVWLNRRPEAERVLRVKAVSTEAATSAADSVQSLQDTASTSLPESRAK